MEVVERADGVTLVNDAYNANPDSMRAALTALERMGEGRRTWAVLGTMLELGDESDALHAEVGAEVAARGVDELVVVGAGRRAAGGRCTRGGPGIRGGVAPGSGRCRTPTPPRRCSTRSSRRATWCCSSRAATPGYGCSVTDWPDEGRS